MKNRMLRRSSGVALVTAIFLLVVLAGLGVAVVSLTTTQRTGAVQDEQGTRAYLAARAGIEWALYRRLVANPVLVCPGTYSFSLPANTTLSGFTVTVICSAPAAAYGTGDASDPTAGRVQITVTACNLPLNNACPNATPSPDYVQRVIRAQL